MLVSNVALLEENQKEQESGCTLCGMSIGKQAYSDQEQMFCCGGCQAVYQILNAQHALDHFRDHPLFQQALRSGLISNPSLLEEARQHSSSLQEEECQKLHMEVEEMWCPSCAEVIRLTLIKEKGIRHCIVDYSTDLGVIEYTPRYISKEKIYRLIQELGYHPRPLEEMNAEKRGYALNLRFIVACFFSLNIMMFAYPIYASYFETDTEQYAQFFAWLSFAGALPVVTYSAWPIWRRFYTGLRVGILGMELLVVIGVSAAFILSLYELWQESPYVYFDSMTTIIVFVLLGKMIESKAKFSAKDSLFRLTRTLPRRGRKVNSDGSKQFVPLKDIGPGDEFLALTGEKIVLDGLIVEGEAACDESLMTGESIPILKKEGDFVLAGSLLKQGHLKVKVTGTLQETALYRIVEMVEQDLSRKSAYVRSADRIIGWFVPLVLLLAFLTAAYCWIGHIQDPGYSILQTVFIRAVSVLLISCPCAIGIAAPLAESQLLYAFASLGAIVRNRGCLAFLGRETVFAFDKTGTITEGKFTVLRGLDTLDKDSLKELKGLVSYSNHPISVALNQQLLIEGTRFDSIEEIVGKGIKGVQNTCCYYLGSSNFLQQQGILIPSIFLSVKTEQIKTHVFFAKAGHCLACIVLGDCLRPNAKEMISTLSKDVETLLVSGDGPSSVESVANACFFKKWHASFQPLQKRELIDSMRKKGEIVGMLGDGINDAPALTAAHISIAVVSATDVSIQVSDVLLTTDRLEVILQLRKLAQKGRHIIKQNLFWAFFYNVVGIILAMTGCLTPLFAAFAMVISSLIVLFNAKRIKS